MNSYITKHCSICNPKDPYCKHHGIDDFVLQNFKIRISKLKPASRDIRQVHHDQTDTKLGSAPSVGGKRASACQRGRCDRYFVFVKMQEYCLRTCIMIGKIQGHCVNFWKITFQLPDLVHVSAALHGLMLMGDMMDSSFTLRL
jgi:hypothetical protein